MVKRRARSEGGWEEAQEEIGKLREDLGGSWLRDPVSVEATADQYVRPELRQVPPTPLPHHLSFSNTARSGTGPKWSTPHGMREA